MRAKGLHLRPNLSSNAQRQLDKDLDHYESAVNQGLSPEGTTREKVDRAFKEAELNG